MQVLWSGCQFPSFRLRWLQIVWSIGEKERDTSELQGRRFEPQMGWQLFTWPFWHHCCYYLVNFNMPSLHLPQEAALHLHNLLSFDVISLSYYAGTHHTELMYRMVSASVCQSAHRCHTRCCVVCSRSYRSQHSLFCFIYKWQLYPLPLLCWFDV